MTLADEAGLRVAHERNERELRELRDLTGRLLMDLATACGLTVEQAKARYMPDSMPGRPSPGLPRPERGHLASGRENGTQRRSCVCEVCGDPKPVPALAAECEQRHAGQRLPGPDIRQLIEEET